MSLQHVRELISETDLRCFAGICDTEAQWLCVSLADPVAAVLCSCDEHRAQLPGMYYAVITLDEVRDDVDMWADMHGDETGEVIEALTALLVDSGRRAA